MTENTTKTGAIKPSMSRTKAIHEKCKDCIWDQSEPGTWRQQTEACTIKSCTLWPFRPLSTGAKK